MPGLRPVNREVLRDVAKEVAEDHAGFLYVDTEPQVKEEIVQRYEEEDSTFWTAQSVSRDDIVEALEAVVDEKTFWRRSPEGTFFFDLHHAPGQRWDVPLRKLFANTPLVTKNRIKAEFGVSGADIDFLCDRLTENRYLSKLEVSGNEYFGPGDRIKESVPEGRIEDRLANRSRRGKIDRSQLEEVIDVPSFDGVVEYLEEERFLTPLGDEYLVRSAQDSFVSALARQIEDPVEREFQEADHVLPGEEFETVVRNRAEEVEPSLAKGRGRYDHVLAKTREALVERLHLEEDQKQGLYYQPAALEDFVDATVDDLFETANQEREWAATKEDFEEIRSELIADLDLGKSGEAERFLERRITAEFDRRVQELLEGGKELVQ